MLNLIKLSIFALLLGFMTNKSYALDLPKYLDLVEESNSSFIATKKNKEVKLLRQDEHSINFVPSFFLNGVYSNDQRPNTSPSVLGTKTERTYYQAGLSQALRTGTKATLSYNILKTDMFGAPAVSEPLFYDIYPQLELTQSLWRNFNGAEIRAQENQQKSQAEIDFLSESLKYKQLILGAELAYWRLYFSQKNFQVLTENLERAKKLKEWNQKRYRDNLVDEADAIQTDANYLTRELEYQSAADDLAQAERDYFKTLEKEDLQKSYLDLTESDKEITKLVMQKLPSTAGVREDVQISGSQLIATQAQAILGRERNRPTWEVYGTYSRTGRDATQGRASEDSWHNEGPYTMIGTRLVWTLDFFAANRYNDAYSQEIITAEVNHRRKVFELEKEWSDLTKKFNDYQKRLSLVEKIEETQNKKLLSEKKRFSSGRSTTFQVLQFEQDYANAQISKLKIQEAILAIYAQSKLFLGTQYE
jgi:outer membrane protein TolC